MHKPKLITFDIFGTVLDWQTGLSNSVTNAGFNFKASDMDRVVDIQGLEEQEKFQSYKTITQNSLIKAFGMDENIADEIASNVGSWPLFKDSKAGMKALMEIAPCIAMTNSDYIHGKQVQAQLGFNLSKWVCAEEVKIYKPNPDFWKIVSEKTGIKYGTDWWHVSAYADYDLKIAKELGLTCVFIPRAHSRKGFSHFQFENLIELADFIANNSE